MLTPSFVLTRRVDVFPNFLRGKFGSYIARVSSTVLGGVLCAAVSTLFLACWFSSKEEMQGLKEVFQT